MDGGFRTRAALLWESDRWPTAVAALHGTEDPTAVPEALDRLADAAVSRYAAWGHASPVMLVHAATAPRAASLVLPSLPSVLWPATHRAAWVVSAAVVSAYRPAGPADHPALRRDPDMDDVVERAVRLGDAHAVKFVETALDAHRRGSPDAARAADRAVDLIALDD